MTRPGYCFGVMALSFTTMCASQRANETHPIARKLTVEGVPNFGEVNSTLYRGAQPTPAGFEKLTQMGIRIVVDARERGIEGERKQ